VITALVVVVFSLLVLIFIILLLAECSFEERTCRGQYKHSTAAKKTSTALVVVVFSLLVFFLVGSSFDEGEEGTCC
jgi:hypothetical protein